MGRIEPPGECAHCGADIPRKALACPECGADERTGWRETSVYDGLDLPDADSSGQSATGGKTAKVFWWVVGAGLLVLLAFGALGLRP